MSPGPTMERVYEALKAELVTGVRRPGAKLDPAKLAYDLNVSATPVRDALHRLVGERLVEAQPQEGFRAIMPTETMLRDNYAWSLDVLLLALRHMDYQRPIEDQTTIQGGPVVADQTRLLFERIVGASDNVEHRDAMRRINDRLHLARQFETRLIADVDEELASIAMLFDAAKAVQLKRRLIAYHHQRERLVPKLVAILALHAGGEVTPA